jgi:hypothetical protein
MKDFEIFFSHMYYNFKILALLKFIVHVVEISNHNSISFPLTIQMNIKL